MNHNYLFCFCLGFGFEQKTDYANFKMNDVDHNRLLQTIQTKSKCENDRRSSQVKSVYIITVIMMYFYNHTAFTCRNGDDDGDGDSE